MGPVSTRWYEDRGVPFEWRETSGKVFEKSEYRHYLESYSCGRIDIYGLDEKEHWGGRSEYSVAPMRTEDWNALGDWLRCIWKLTMNCGTYDRTHRTVFNMITGIEIRWSIENADS